MRLVVTVVAACVVIAQAVNPYTSLLQQLQYTNQYGNQYTNQYGNQFGNQYGNQFGNRFGSQYGYPVFPVAAVKPGKPLQLTCSNVMVGGKGDFGSIAANIKEKRGPGYGSPFGNFFNPKGALGHPGDMGLQADFELFSTKGGKLALIVTENGFAGDGCLADNFGKGLSPRTASGGGYGAGYGGGLSFGFANPQQLFAGKGGYGHGGPGAGRVLPDGVVAEVKLDPGVLQALSFDTLNGFRNIKQLAGRGLLACTDVESEYDGTAVCVGHILACCTLAYDRTDRVAALPHS